LTSFAEKRQSGFSVYALAAFSSPAYASTSGRLAEFGYSYGCFGARDMFRVGRLLTLVESLILILLAPFYWPLIGI
jgi:hypothetical protein